MGRRRGHKVCLSLRPSTWIDFSLIYGPSTWMCLFLILRAVDVSPTIKVFTVGTFRVFGTERARLGTFRGFGTERARLGTF